MSKQYGKGYHDGRRKAHKEDLVVAGVLVGALVATAVASALFTKKKKNPTPKN